MTRLCVSVSARDMGPLMELAREAELRGADLVELRLDGVRDLDLRRLEELRVETIGTLRSVAQGGLFIGTRSSRTSLLASISERVDMLDLEADDEETGSPERAIRSHHCLEGTPPSDMIVSMARSLWRGGRVAKIAAKVRGARDLLSILEASEGLRREGGEFALMGMGPLGPLTRVTDIGSSLIYCSLPGRSTASGQLDLGEMNDAYSGIITGLIGWPLSHSMSRVMQNVAFRSTGVKGTYLELPTRERELGAMLEVVRGYGMRGVNITIPHKEAVMGHLDRMERSAREAGAVNTVVVENGEMVGHNTDMAGLETALEGVSMGGMEALVIGAGGAARAACALLRREGARINVLNRTPERGEAMAKEFGGRAWSSCPPGAEFDLVINCTPLGMKGFPGEMPLPEGCIREGMEVMDTVYNPLTTPLLATAKEKGANVHSGLDMLVHQGAAAFELWTGRRPDASLMTDSVRGRLE